MKNIMKDKYYLQKNFYNNVLSKTENLRVFPRMYPMFWKSPYRKISIQNYIILYIIEKNIIRISNIFPTKSKYSNQTYLKYR